MHDALSHPDLLELCPQAEIVDVGKLYGRRATPQFEINALLLRYAKQGKNVVRLKGGDPLMFARGSEEALALAEAKITFEIVPGVTSPVAASAFAGISLTHRDASSSVTFITGSDKKGKEWSDEAWKKLATATGTICVFMGMRRIAAITRAIVEGGRRPQTPAAVVQWGARPEQRTVVGTLETIADEVEKAGLSNPAIIIVGEVVALRDKLRWYDNRPLFGRGVLVPRPVHQARETARALRHRGAVPIMCPAIEILGPPDPAQLQEAVQTAKDYDWVVFTSANGVTAFFSVVRALGLDARVFGLSRVAAIGPKTSQALERFGIHADLVAREFVAERLVEDLLRVTKEGARILIPRASEAREILPEALRRANLEVRVVAAYQTFHVKGEAAKLLQRQIKEDAEIVLFSSSSMVDAVVQALGSEASETLGQRTLACIGPVTAATLRNYGLEPSVEASVYTMEGLLDALENMFGSAA